MKEGRKVEGEGRKEGRKRVKEERKEEDEGSKEGRR